MDAGLGDASVRVATWNVQAIRGLPQRRADRIGRTLAHHGVDVLGVQEVSILGSTLSDLCRQLRWAGLTEVTYFDNGRADEKKYVSMIASRWPVRPIEWPAALRWPQLLAAAHVASPIGDVTFVSAHIPNGTGNGWEKVSALEALNAGLLSLPDSLILVGDFNEPKEKPPPWWSFRMRPDGSVAGVFRDRFGVTCERRRWQDAVVAVLDDTGVGHRTSWGGRHAQTDAGRPFEPTHRVTGGHHRYFDHIVTSGRISIKEVVYDHHVRIGDEACSDHSLVMATLGQRPAGC